MRWLLLAVVALQLPAGAPSKAAADARREAIELMNAAVDRHDNFDRFNARRGMQAATAKHPSYWRLRVNLARLLLGEYRFDEAERELLEALRLLDDESSRPEIQDDLGRLYFARARDREFDDHRQYQADLRRAAAAFEQAIQTEHPDPRTLHDRARVLDALGDPVEADRSYRSCIALRPDHGPCYADLARMYHDYGYTSLAIAVLEIATKTIETDAHPWFALTEIRLDLGQPRRAIEAASEARRLDPELAEVLLPLGIAYADVGDYDESLATLLLYMETIGNRVRFREPEIAFRVSGQVIDGD